MGGGLGLSILGLLAEASPPRLALNENSNSAMTIFLLRLAAAWEQKQDTLRDVWLSGRISLGSLLGCGPVLSFGRPGQKHPAPTSCISRATTDLNLRCHGNGFWSLERPSFFCPARQDLKLATGP